MNPKDRLYNNKLYKIIETKFDIVGQCYEMKIRCFWMFYYSRRQSSQYSIVYRDMNISISLETPLVVKQTKANDQNICKTLLNNWWSIFDYAIERKNINWISYTEGGRHEYKPMEKTDIMNFLELEDEEFEKIHKQSPYS